MYVGERIGNNPQLLKKGKGVIEVLVVQK